MSETTEPTDAAAAEQAVAEQPQEAPPTEPTEAERLTTDAAMLQRVIEVLMNGHAWALQQLAGMQASAYHVVVVPLDGPPQITECATMDEVCRELAHVREFLRNRPEKERNNSHYISVYRGQAMGLRLGRQWQVHDGVNLHDVVPPAGIVAPHSPTNAAEPRALEEELADETPDVEADPPPTPPVQA
jgi:hypothetical protein